VHPAANPREHVRRLLADLPTRCRASSSIPIRGECLYVDIHNRPSLSSYTRTGSVRWRRRPSGLALCGIRHGMAIEDAIFSRATLRDEICATPRRAEISRPITRSVKFCNNNVEFARKLGYQFHYANRVQAWLRDFIFDNTGILQKMINKACWRRRADDAAIARAACRMTAERMLGPVRRQRRRPFDRTLSNASSILGPQWSLVPRSASAHQTRQSVSGHLHCCWSGLAFAAGGG